MQTFLLLHGSWHDGHVWEAVAGHLRAQGVHVHAPTIAGHGAGADKRISHADCVASVVDYVRRHDLRDLVVLGHSWGGTIVQRLAEEVPERCRRLVFHNAFVLRDGEALFDLLPPHYQVLWKNAVDGQGGIMLPFPVWRDGFIGDASLEQATEAYARLSPTPSRSHFDAVPLKRFDALKIPRSWLYATEDVALPPGQYGWHPRMSERLGGYRLVALPGSHEVCFSNPALLAEKILVAGRD